MRANHDTKTQVMHSNKFTHSAVLRVVQGHATVFRRNLQSEASKIPKVFQCVFIDFLKVKIVRDVAVLKQVLQMENYSVRVVSCWVVNFREELCHWINESSDVFCLLFIQGNWIRENFRRFDLSIEQVVNKRTIVSLGLWGILCFSWLNCLRWRFFLSLSR